MNVVLWMSSSLTRIWWYPDGRSTFEKYTVPCILLISSSIRGIGYLFFMVFLFSDSWSMHNIIVPCFFFTITTNKVKGLEPGWMCPISSSSFMAFSISSLNLLGWLYGVVMMWFNPYYFSMTCSNPLSSGIPTGNGSNTLSCFLGNICISTG